MSKEKNKVICLVVIAPLLLLTSAARTRAGAIETVYVGNPGNPGELSGVGAGGAGQDVIVGGVDYGYRMGKYEITTRQYTEFLNAVARQDTYGLYDIGMVQDPAGCQIIRNGQAGTYTYSVGPDFKDLPVNYVSWGDAARYANWLHNGQPTGLQNHSTTEDGSYFLNGTVSGGLLDIVRTSDATWVIPTEDEWYKAAYHKNNGATGDYWDYPMGSSDRPDNGIPGGDSGNSANFWDGEYVVGPPYWRTAVGHYSESRSPYGTFDQGGNVWEWNETAVQTWYRGLRGGSFAERSFGLGDGVTRLRASNRFRFYPIEELSYIGFRLAYVPEPSTLASLAICGVIVLTDRRRSAVSQDSYRERFVIRGAPTGDHTQLNCRSPEGKAE
jgi:formylglycine-generating enzyme required for sulfatase activity